MDDRERHEQGMEVRRAILGDAHVDRARARDFTRDFQDLVTRYAWGEIWSRPGLPRPTRSLVTVAMLIALRQHEELRLHVRAALRIGVTRAELNELLLHAVIYCGAPAAHSAYGIVEEILGEAPGP